MSLGDLVIVVPCYNEAKRLDLHRLTAFFEDPTAALLLVDDGSRDETYALIEAFAAKHPGKARALKLERNGGKAEAVRQGLLAAIDAGARYVGFADADLATPPGEVLRIARVVHDEPAVAMAMGARVALLGRVIERSTVRHLLGRVFATAASLTLDLPVYDTQCGAKAFRVTDELRAALSTKFISPWIFDVELISRLMANGVPSSGIVEVPLFEWRDVAGSKLKASAMARSALDMARIAIARRR